MELSHHDKMRDLEKNFFKQASNIESIHKAKIEKILKNASSTAQRNVQEQETCTETQNKQLMSELRNFHKELDNLKKDRRHFVEENKVLYRDVSLAEESLEQYHNVNQQQNEKIRVAKEKIEFLKSFISQEAIKYTKELELEKYRHQALIREYQINIKELKQFLLEKSEEQKALRMLANKILRQREDLEEFFLDSIEQIKEKGGEESGGKYRERVDIAELKREDREKILRIVFAKINNGSKAGVWDKGNEERE